jgi:hypothetical protein
MADFIPPGLKKFRASIKSGAFFILLLSATGTCIGLILLRGFADVLRHLHVLVGVWLFVDVPLSFLFGLALVLKAPVAFSNEGIYGYSVRGTKCFLRWEDILQVRRFRFLNLTYLRIYSKVNKNALWLALFQSQPIEFMHEIGKFAPPDSPIRNHLHPINT